MKKMVLVLVGTLLLTSCGKDEPLTQLGEGIKQLPSEVWNGAEQVGQVPRVLANAALGDEAENDRDSNAESINNNKDDIAELKQELADLKLQISNESDAVENRIDSISIDHTNFKENVKNSLRVIRGKVRRVKRASRRNNRRINRLSRQLSRISSELEDFIDGYTTTIDPCGDDPSNYDEVLIKLYDGTILAVFKDGKYFMSKLEDGNYRTTDRQRCIFSIQGGEYIGNN